MLITVVRLNDLVQVWPAALDNLAVGVLANEVLNAANDGIHRSDVLRWEDIEHLLRWKSRLDKTRTQTADFNGLLAC
jgi:hypothetical protein